MKKYLSIILGIILTACMVTCGSSDKDFVDNQDEEVISNQEVSDMMLFIWDILKWSIVYSSVQRVSSYNYEVENYGIHR